MADLLEKKPVSTLEITKKDMKNDLNLDKTKSFIQKFKKDIAFSDIS
ncbi:MAG: hypothetical protein ACFFCI_04330 [Promethearchaeota archaeon]